MPIADLPQHSQSYEVSFSLGNSLHPSYVVERTLTEKEMADHYTRAEVDLRIAQSDQKHQGAFSELKTEMVRTNAKLDQIIVEMNAKLDKITSDLIPLKALPDKIGDIKTQIAFFKGWLAGAVVILGGVIAISTFVLDKSWTAMKSGITQTIKEEVQASQL